MAFGSGVYQRLDMVCGGGDGFVRDCGVKDHYKNEEWGVRSFRNGLITGLGIALVLFLVITAFRFFEERDRKAIEYMEAQNELQIMQEDIGNRPPDEFLEDPGVRGAADSADAEFRRKRDEAVRAIRRSRIAR
jgi:hypothetical protein